MRPRGNPHTDRRRIERTAEHRRRRRRPLSQTTTSTDRTSQRQYDVNFPVLSTTQATSSVATSSLAVDVQTIRQESRSLFGVAPGQVAPSSRYEPSQLENTPGPWTSLPNFSPSFASPSRSFSEVGSSQHVQACTIGRRQPTNTSNTNHQPHTMTRVQEQLDMMRGLWTGALTADDARSISATMAATLAQAGADEDWLGMLDDQGDVFVQPWARLPGGINRSDRPRRPMARTDLNSTDVPRQNDSSSKMATFVYSVDDAKTGSDVWPDIRDPTKLPATFMPLDMASRASSLRADVNKRNEECADDEMKRPVWPMNELPSEIYFLITETLSRDDIKAMRLTCKEMEHHISGILFRNVVVPFNTEIYGMMFGVTDEKAKDKGKAKIDGTGFWRNSKEEDIYTGHGVDVFRSFGSSIKRFGMSFEVDEEVLANPPLKGTREDHKSYWGVYQWPFPEYKRFDQVAGLEDAADETPKMKTAFSFLNDVQELALSLDAGLGWLNGPDRSLRSRVLGEKRPVFGDGRAVLGRKEEARQWLWEYLKEWADGRSGVDLRHCTISKQSYHEAQDSPVRPVQQPTNNRQFSTPHWAEDDSEDLDDFDDAGEQFVLSAPTRIPTAFDSSSYSRSPMRHARHSVQDMPSPPVMDSGPSIRPPPFTQNRFDTLDGSSFPFSLHLLQPSTADAAVPPLDLQGVVDPVAKPTPLLTLMENVHLQQMLVKARPDSIAPRARERGFLIVKEDPVEPERLEAYPIVPVELSKLQKEWLLETEWAQRAFLSSWLIAVVDNRPTFQHVRTVNFARLSSRFLLSLCREDLWKALPQLEKVVLGVIPDCRDVVKNNAGFVDTPRVLPIAAVWMMQKLITEMIATRSRITTLELGWMGGGERAEGLLARYKNLMPSPLLPPEWLSSAENMMNKRMLKERMPRLPHVRELTLRNCWSTPHGLELLVGEHAALEVLRLESVSLTAEPVGAGGNAQAILGAHQPGGVAQNPGLLQVLGVQTDLLPPRHGSWPQLLDIISPRGEGENNVAMTLQVLEIRSAGYCRLNNARLDETAIPAVYSGGTTWFAKRHAALLKVMLTEKGGVTAEIVQAIPPHEQQVLTGLGLEMGWPREWADDAEGCIFNGLLMGGTGRFSGLLKRLQ